jgi:hypothetical protein
LTKYLFQRKVRHHRPSITGGDMIDFTEQVAVVTGAGRKLVPPLVVYLASRACDFSHRNFSACGGRFARVFVGLSEGWLADPDSNPTADDIAARIGEIAATQPFTVPGSIYEEVFAATERLGITT